jgi:acetyltransferase
MRTTTRGRRIPEGRVLIAVATLALEQPLIRELDINPLLAGHRSVLAIDARIAVGPEAAGLETPGNVPAETAVRRVS